MPSRSRNVARSPGMSTPSTDLRWASQPVRCVPPAMILTWKCLTDLETQEHGVGIGRPVSFGVISSRVTGLWLIASAISRFAQWGVSFANEDWHMLLHSSSKDPRAYSDWETIIHALSQHCLFALVDGPRRSETSQFQTSSQVWCVWKRVKSAPDVFD